MEMIRILRMLFYREAGSTRLGRIAMCTFVIGLVWIIADAISGSLSANPYHNALCLMMGVVAERLLPWGKEDDVKIRQIAENYMRRGK